MQSLLPLVLSAISLLAPFPDPPPSAEITPAETAVLRASMVQLDRLSLEVEEAADAAFSAGSVGNLDELDAALELSVERSGVHAHAAATWAATYLQAAQGELPVTVEDTPFPGGAITKAEHEPILGAFVSLHSESEATWQAFRAALTSFRTGEASAALESFQDARGRLEASREAALAVGELLWNAIKSDPPPPGPDWPTLDDVPKGEPAVRWFVQQSIKDGPDPDGVFRVRLPKGVLRGVAFAIRTTDPPRVDPRPFGDALVEVYGHPDGGTVIDGHRSGGEYSKGWGVTWQVDGVPGWAGRIHHFDITFRSSGSNALQIGDYCPDEKWSQPVEDCRFIRCALVGTEGVVCKRPVSANYCGLGFYECTWSYTAETACEHGVYTRNALWLELVGCLMDGVGAQFNQNVNRLFEYDEECHWEPALEGYLLIKDCVFKQPGLHGAGCGGGPGAGLTIAGAGWDVRIENVVVIDDGTGKDHDPKGIPGATYAGATVWSGGLHKTAVRPSGKPNGFIDIDGLYVWYHDPTRSLLSLSQCEGARVRNSYFCGGPNQIRPIDIETTAFPVAWERFDPGGRQVLIDHGADPAAMLLPQMRLDGELVGPADGNYSLN